jgi:hypothetical protein
MDTERYETMQISNKRASALYLTLGFAVASITASSLTIRPASAGQNPKPDKSTTTCSSANPCKNYVNNGAGPGLNAQAANYDGMQARTYNPSATQQGRSGIAAFDASTDGGSGNYGVFGGAVGAGTGVDGTTQTGIGVLGRAFGGLAGYFDGNVQVNGLLYTNGSCKAGCSKTRHVITYPSRQSEPTIEDVGEANLVGGHADVLLDPAFANVIAPRTRYLVFITPEGETGSLYVAQRTERGFEVRESRGGHSSAPFAYRIVAKPYGAVANRLPMLDVPKGALAAPIRPSR